MIKAGITIALAALANRAWGSVTAWKIPSVLLSAFAFSIAQPTLWHWSAIVALLVWFGRVFTTRPLHTEPFDWTAAIIRTYAWVPLFVFVMLVTHEEWRLMFAVCVPLILAIYWLDAQYSPFEKLVLAELLTGAYIGASFVVW